MNITCKISVHNYGRVHLLIKKSINIHLDKVSVIFYLLFKFFLSSFIIRDLIARFMLELDFIVF